MLPFIFTFALAGIPGAYELDFGPLVANPRGSYEYTIVLSFEGEPDVRIPILHPRKEGPEGAASFFMEAMKDPRWKIEQNKTRVTIHGYDDVPILKVTVEEVKGGGPAVRRLISLPLDKKK